MCWTTLVVQSRSRVSPVSLVCALGWSLMGLALAPSGSRLEAQVIARGEISLPAATEIGSGPGFHERILRAHTVPDDLGPTQGRRLVVRLWDSSRPGITCSSEHPVSGCATVDWPLSAGDEFLNRVALVTPSGRRELHLRLDGSLSPDPQPPDPG